jgi:hypothetical protein
MKQSLEFTLEGLNAHLAGDHKAAEAAFSSGHAASARFQAHYMQGKNSQLMDESFTSEPAQKYLADMRKAYPLLGTSQKKQDVLLRTVSNVATLFVAQGVREAVNMWREKQYQKQDMAELSATGKTRAAIVAEKHGVEISSSKFIKLEPKEKYNEDFQEKLKKAVQEELRKRVQEKINEARNEHIKAKRTEDLHNKAGAPIKAHSQQMHEKALAERKNRIKVKPQAHAPA